MDKDFLIVCGTIPWIIFLCVVMYVLRGNSKNNRKLKSVFWFVFIFSAIRYGIGYDYFSYKYVIDGNAPSYVLERWEIIPRYLAIICGHIHSQLFFAICSFITIYPIYYVSKRLSVLPIVSFALFLLFPSFFLNSLGVIRNGAAYSLVFLAFYYLHTGKKVKSVLTFFAAIGFHTSAFIAILIYPLYYLFHSRSLNTLLYILSIVLSSVIVPILLAHFSDVWFVTKLLVNAEKELQGGGLFTYIVNFIAIFNIINWKKIASFSKENPIYLTLVNWSACIWNSFLYIDLTTAERISTFYMLFIIMLVPSFKYVFKNKIIYKCALLFFVLLFISSIYLNLRAYYVKGINMSNIPYQIFFLFPSDLFYH